MKRSLLIALCIFPCWLEASEQRLLAPGEAGHATCGAAPAGWERPAFDDSAWPVIAADSRALTAPPDGGVPRNDGGTSQVDAGAPPPCTVVHMRRRFDLVSERPPATLTLHVRYSDGFVAWLNGVEVARRRLVDGAPLASEVHGAERESFPVTVTPGLLQRSNNVIAVEVHAAKSTRRAIVDLGVDGGDGPRITRGPYLQRVGTSEGWLIVETDLPTEVELAWQRGASGPPRTLTDVSARRHVLHLVHLAPATLYHYRVTLRSRDPEGSVISESDFHTPPAPGRPLRFALFGDVRSGHEVHAAIVKAVAIEDPDLAVLTGDLVDRGGDEAEWERFFDVEEPLLRQVAVYPVLGNHEYGGHGVDRSLTYFLRPGETAWWSFDIAGVHFVMLDSGAYNHPEQLAWLEGDLAAARRKKTRAIFVVNHDGPFSSGLHGDNKLAVRDYTPLYARYHVAMVFSGHDHDYERLRVGSVDYCVSGGGGAELRNPRCGVPGKKPCPARSKIFANEHHYLMVEVQRDRFTVCPKRPDGTLLEACPSFPLRR